MLQGNEVKSGRPVFGHVLRFEVSFRFFRQEKSESKSLSRLCPVDFI